MDRISISKYYPSNEPATKSSPSRYISNGDLTSSIKSSKMSTASPSPPSTKLQSAQQQALSKGLSSSQRTHTNSKYIQPSLHSYLFKKSDNDENSYSERNKLAKTSRESKLIQKIDKLALESLEKRDKLENDLRRLEASKERSTKEKPFSSTHTNNAAASSLDSASKIKFKSKEKPVKYKPNDLSKLKYSYYINNNYTTLKNRNESNQNRSVDRSQPLATSSLNHVASSRKLSDSNHYYTTTRNNLEKKSSRLTTSGLGGSTYNRSTKFVPAPTPDKEAERSEENKMPSSIGLQKTASKNESSGSEESELFKKIMAKLSELPDSVFLNPPNYSNISSRNSLYNGSLSKKSGDYLLLNSNHGTKNVLLSHSNETSSHSNESPDRRKVLSIIHDATHLPVHFPAENSGQLAQIMQEPIREASVGSNGVDKNSTDASQAREEENSKEKERDKVANEKKDRAKSASEVKKTIIYIEPSRTKTSKNPIIVSIKKDADTENNHKSSEEQPQLESKSHGEPKMSTHEAQKIEIIDKTRKSETKRTPEIENFAQFEHQMRDLISNKLEPNKIIIQAESKSSKTDDNEQRTEKTSNNKRESEKQKDVITFLKVVNVDHQANTNSSNPDRANQSNRIKIIRINSKDQKADTIETIQLKTIKIPDSISSNQMKSQLNQHHQEQKEQHPNERLKSDDHRIKPSKFKEPHQLDDIVPIVDNVLVNKVAHISINKKSKEEPNESIVSGENKEPKAAIVSQTSLSNETSNREVASKVEPSGHVGSKVIENIESKWNDEMEKPDETQYNINKIQLPPVRKISTPPPIPNIIHDPVVAESFIAAAAAAAAVTSPTTPAISLKSKPSLARNDSNHLVNDEVATINGYSTFGKPIQRHQEFMIDTLFGNKRQYYDVKPMRRHASNYTLPTLANASNDSKQSSSNHGAKKSDRSSDISNKLGNSKYRKGSVDSIASKTSQIGVEIRQYEPFNSDKVGDKESKLTKTSISSNKNKDQYIESVKLNRENVYFDANGLLTSNKNSRNSALSNEDKYSAKTSGNTKMIPIKTYKESSNPKSFYENYAKENDKRKKEGSDFLMLLPGIAIPIDTDASDTDDDLPSSSTMN